ncbi:hypothetical protein CPB83DRAFT_849452 [Crepidotus variabilis]|uniref:Uncharacterized protein n=1 Tax=Crepidotus variabilis TaxID=179855 RepID=A0A9P6ELR2_9AGAR|nr:hypothetical protein CPB83DRAFT_849452 [Crepidotus variabilis]
MSKIRLTETPNLRMLQSAALINGLRILQNDWYFDQDPLQDPERQRSIAVYVQEALAYGSSKKDLSDLEFHRAYEEASLAIGRYLKEKNDACCLADFQAARAAPYKHITQQYPSMRKSLLRGLDIVKRAKIVEINVIIWPQRVRLGNGWASHKLPFVIEGDATLDILLVRIISSMPSLRKRGVQPFSLLQNPQFFSGFPHNNEAWERFLATNPLQGNETNKFRPLDLSIKVKDIGKSYLNLIIDRAEGLDIQDPEVMVFGDMSKMICKTYRNIWKLEGSDRYIVREITGSLTLIEPSRKSNERTSWSIGPTNQLGVTTVPDHGESFSTDYSSLNIPVSSHSSQATLPSSLDFVEGSFNISGFDRLPAPAKPAKTQLADLPTGFCIID